jgi:hypothetical protein
MKGFEKDDLESETMSEAEKTVKVKGPKVRTRGKFFDTILAKSKDFFAEEE